MYKNQTTSVLKCNLVFKKSTLGDFVSLTLRFVNKELSIVSATDVHSDVLHVHGSVINRTDSHHRLGHMKHMPQEIHQLQQQACSSLSSRRDEMSHAWRTCPGRKHLGSTWQRNGRSGGFSRSTVQYIIDCNNRPASCAGEDSTQDGLSDVNESLVSPASKQPRIDVVDF